LKAAAATVLMRFVFGAWWVGAADGAECRRLGGGRGARARWVSGQHL